MKIKKNLFLLGFLIGGCAIAVFFLSIVLYCALLFPPVQQFVLAIAKPLYENILNGKTSIGGIQSNLITYVIIKDVEIRDTVHNDNSVLLDYVKIDFWSPALLFKKIVINSVSVNNVSMRISIPTDNKFTFPAVPRSVASAEHGTKNIWKVELGTVKIKKMNAVYKDSSNGVFVSIKDATVRSDFYRIDSLLLSVRGFENSVKTPWWSGKLDTVTTAAVITSKGAMVNDFTLKGPDFFSQMNGRLPFVSSEMCDLNGHVRADLKPFSKSNANLQWLSGGMIAVRAHWSGTLVRPILNVNVSGYKIKTEKIKLDSINIGCEYNDEQLSFITHAQSSDLKAKIAGECKISELFYNPQLGKYTAKITLEGQTVSAMKMLLPEIKINNAGKIKVVAVASGAGLLLPDNSVADMVIETDKDTNNNLVTHMALKKHFWKIDGKWVENKISGEGHIREDLQLTGKLKLDFPEVKLVVKTLIGQNVTGQIESDITFAGAPQLIEIKSELRSNNLKWNNLTLSTLTGKINYKNKQIFVENIDASISGKCDSLLRILHVDSCGGNIELDIKASGVLPKLNVDATLRGNDVYYKQITASKIDLDFITNSTDSINMRNAVIEKDTSRVVVGGLVVLKPRIELNLNGKTEMKSNKSDWHSAGKLQMNAILTKKKIKGELITSALDVSILNQWYPLPHNVFGIVTSNVEAEGTLYNPQLNGQFEINGAGYDRVKLSAVRGSVNMADSVIKSKFMVFISDTLSHLQVDANLPIRPQHNWSIDTSGMRDRIIVVSSDTFNVAEIGLSKDSSFSVNGPVLGKLTMTGAGSAWELDGKVSLLGDQFYYEPYDVNIKNIFADLRIQGRSDNPDISFNLSSDEANVSSKIVTQARVNGRIKEKTVYIDSASLGIDHLSALTISGQIPLVATDILLSKSDFFVKYKITALPLKLMELIAPDMYITGGVIDGNGAVFIKNGRLQSDGFLSLTKGVVEPELIDQKIGPVKGTLVFKGDSIVLENWTGVVGKGSFDLEGYGTLSSGGTLGLSLTLKGKNVILDAQDLVKSQVHKVELHLGNAKLKNHYLLEGTINFGPTRFVRDIQINDIMELSKSQNEKVKIKSINDSVELRIDLQFQDNLYIDMNLGDMQLQGKIAVLGTVSKPAYTGEITVVQGSVLYLDRKFEINKGNINFVSPTELNPSIYLDAKTEVNSFARGSSQNVTYFINLIVSGNLEHPVVTLTSDPPLDEPNIVSILTLGTTMGSVGSDITSRIGSMVGNKFLGFGTRTLERFLNLERVTVSGNILDTKDSLNGPQLSVTKRLSDRLTLSYESTFGASNQQKLSVLYRLFPFLFLTGQTGTSGDSKIMLKFRVNR